VVRDCLSVLMASGRDFPWASSARERPAAAGQDVPEQSREQMPQAAWQKAARPPVQQAASLEAMRVFLQMHPEQDESTLESAHSQPAQLVLPRAAPQRQVPEPAPWALRPQALPEQLASLRAVRQQKPQAHSASLLQAQQPARVVRLAQQAAFGQLSPLHPSRPCPLWPPLRAALPLPQRQEASYGLSRRRRQESSSSASSFP
jgi:hypothetical protein